jgi:hypothetical protein
VSRDALLRYALRGTAIAIAVAAAIDPAVTSQRNAKPEISVIAGQSVRDSTLAASVEHALAKNFTVLPASFARASATVLVGTAPRLDDASIADLALPAFAVTPDTNATQISIEQVTVPSVAPLDARVPVAVRVRANGAANASVAITLAASGGTVDQIVKRVANNNQEFDASLSYLPTAAGAAPLHVVATLGVGGDSARADLVVDVRDTRWPVLFYDPHPSWMSTFVRRAAERDRRFVISSRVVTTNGIATETGQPSQLDDAAGLSRFDAIVIGAPDALTDAEVRGLEMFLRERGGRVVLLFDAPATGPIRRLIGPVEWIAKTENPSVLIVPADADSTRLRASALAWPRTLPQGAQPLAWATNAASGHATVWQSAVGAGNIVVSGAFDSWRYRDASSSTFTQYWQTLIANEASAAPPAVSVRIARPVVQPGERGDVTVIVRKAALRTTTLLQSPSTPIQSTVSASIDVDGKQTSVALWPASGVGEFRGEFRAPQTPGTYRLVVAADSEIGEAPLIVANVVSAATPSDKDLLRAFVASRGGQTIVVSELAGLPAILTRSLRPAARAELWHPMRSTWWLVVFIAALSAEWWMRRRRGLL